MNGGFTMIRSKSREYTGEFKSRMVLLYLKCKPRSEIIREYDFKKAAFR